MMTTREQFQTLLRRGRAERVLFVSRLDFWHADAVRRGALPPECRGRSIPEIEDLLGMGRSARFGGFHKVVFRELTTVESQDDGGQVSVLEHAGRRLRQTVRQTAEDRQMGMRGHIVEYLLKTAEDYDLMTRLWENAGWQVDHAGFRAFDRAVGGAGLPMIILGPSPADVIMILYAGYENFYLHLADFPERVRRLREVMEKRYEELWPALLESGAELILHGTHWSTSMTPPPVFREQILPYMRRFTDRMRAAGKYTAFHADADLSGLLPETRDTGVDLADCFASAPLVPLELARARNFWKNDLLVWGGLPSTIFMPSCPPAAFRECLDEFLSEARGSVPLIAGISDNLMPGSLWERLEESAARIAAIKPAGA